MIKDKISFEDFETKIYNNVEHEYKENGIARTESFIKLGTNYVLNNEWTSEYEEINVVLDEIIIFGLSFGEKKMKLLVSNYERKNYKKTIDKMEVGKTVSSLYGEVLRYKNLKEIASVYDEEEIEYDFYKNMQDESILKEVVLYTNFRSNDELAYYKDTLDKYNFDINIYCIERIYRSYCNYIEPGDTFIVDISKYNPNLKVLRVPEGSGLLNTTVYLFAMDTRTLGSLYNEYETRLLTDNVRLYLRTSNINKGILKTLEFEPEYFVSYNNGISAIATGIDFNENDGISFIENFQIVNGGQTTASVNEALLRNKIRHPEVAFIPVKLTVIRDSHRDLKLHTKIAKYANTQNKVNESDFASTFDFFIDLKKYSEDSYISETSSLSSKFFFVLMRGQKELYMHKKCIKAKEFKKRFSIVLTPDEIAKIELISNLDIANAAKGKEGVLNYYIENFIKKDDFTYNNDTFKEIIGKKILLQKFDKLTEKSKYAFSINANSKKAFSTVHSKILLYSSSCLFANFKNLHDFCILLFDNDDNLNLLDDVVLIQIIDDTFEYLSDKYSDINEATKKNTTGKDFIKNMKRNYKIFLYD